MILDIDIYNSDDIIIIKYSFFDLLSFLINKAINYINID